MIDYDKLQKSIAHLRLQIENHARSGERPELTTIDREALAESVIQRFETCYDMLWKHLKRHLVEEMGLPEVPNSPKPVFRLAAENNLLPSPTERWMIYADARIATAHDYSGEKAGECLALAPEFLADANRLFERLAGKPAR